MPPTMDGYGMSCHAPRAPVRGSSLSICPATSPGFGKVEMNAGVVDGQDVRMTQSGDGLGFLLKAPKAFAVRREGRRQNLNGYVAIEARVSRFVDLSHAPGADQGGDFVWTNGCGGSERHRVQEV